MNEAELNLQRRELKQIVKMKIESLVSKADVFVFALYDSKDPAGPLIDYNWSQRSEGNPIQMDISLDFEGIGVFYICFRKQNLFEAKHLLLRSEGGYFTHQEFGTFDGYWDDWPDYIADDPWVKALVKKYD